ARQQQLASYDAVLKAWKAAQAKAEPQAPQKPEKLRVLFVDDFEALLIATRQTINRDLGQEGECEIAASVPEALEIMREKEFDLIIYDFALPGFTDEFKEKILKTRFAMVVTGASEDEFKRKCTVELRNHSSYIGKNAKNLEMMDALIKLYRQQQLAAYDAALKAWKAAQAQKPEEAKALNTELKQPIIFVLENEGSEAENLARFIREHTGNAYRVESMDLLYEVQRSMDPELDINLIPDIMITDTHLSDKDILGEVMSMVRAKNPACRFIVTSEEAAIMDLAQFNPSVTVVIEKPFYFGEVVEALRTSCGAGNDGSIGVNSDKKQPLILVLDDFIDDLKNNQEWLEELGYRVHAVTTTGAVRDFLKSGQKPDLIVSDEGLGVPDSVINLVIPEIDNIPILFNSSYPSFFKGENRVILLNLQKTSKEVGVKLILIGEIKKGKENLTEAVKAFFAAQAGDKLTAAQQDSTSPSSIGSKGLSLIQWLCVLAPVFIGVVLAMPWIYQYLASLLAHPACGEPTIAAYGALIGAAAVTGENRNVLVSKLVSLRKWKKLRIIGYGEEYVLAKALKGNRELQQKTKEAYERILLASSRFEGLIEQFLEGKAELRTIKLFLDKYNSDVIPIVDKIVKACIDKDNLASLKGFLIDSFLGKACLVIKIIHLLLLKAKGDGAEKEADIKQIRMEVLKYLKLLQIFRMLANGNYIINRSYFIHNQRKSPKTGNSPCRSSGFSLPELIIGLVVIVGIGALAAFAIVNVPQIATFFAPYLVQFKLALAMIGHSIAAPPYGLQLCLGACTLGAGVNSAKPFGKEFLQLLKGKGNKRPGTFQQAKRFNSIGYPEESLRFLLKAAVIYYGDAPAHDLALFLLIVWKLKEKGRITGEQNKAIDSARQKMDNVIYDDLLNHNPILKEELGSKVLALDEYASDDRRQAEDYILKVLSRKDEHLAATDACIEEVKKIAPDAEVLIDILAFFRIRAEAFFVELKQRIERLGLHNSGPHLDKGG
ncbi:MAG: hypothetical protein NTW13_05535, partial [Candidatus Omnitrophica bacterium]|nr:hypothetical protein [Candidatus Omnitrophota bacterium]